MKKIRKNQKSAFNLHSLTLEGGLFLPDQLEKAALGQASQQKDADYHVPTGLKLKDEYSRAFQIASAQWKQFSQHFERGDVDALALTQGFVKDLLQHAFAYHSIQTSAPILANERAYPVSFIAEQLPIVVAPFNVGLDESLELFAVEGSGSRKKSAFQLAQELLNASDQHLWAIATNGRQLRLLRDAASLTRPSFLEIDLEDILQAQRFSEFTNAWRLVHASRAPQSTQSTDSIWESWRATGQEEGTRVRDGLRQGVEQALLTLGTGFIQHPANSSLRQALDQGTLSKDAYFQQLLRLVYRFIFLFTVEERGLLHPKDDSKQAQQARQAYAQGYALARLRELCLKRRARNRFDDHWQAIRIVFKGLQQGQPHLALPALGGLFSNEQTPDLDRSSLSNTDFLQAIQHLRWAVIAQGKSTNTIPVDYRNMGPEELGSVYESLLELVPTLNLSERRFGFVGLTEEGSTAGNTRKLTGSYYTPDSLVQQLIQSALEPVIAQRLESSPASPTEALLSIRVVDPACGSGHFLLAAARRLAEELAQLRSLASGQEGAIKPQDYRHALREVIGQCIFGVDRNPMAIELARMALWLEGFAEGCPLNFLDHHLQVGDALLGLTDLNILEHGISKDAFKALSGDDKDSCKLLAEQNRNALKQLEKDRKSPQFKLPLEQNSQLAELQRIEAMPQNTLKQTTAQETAYAVFLEKTQSSPLRNAADILVGAYLLPKTPDTQSQVPTTATLMLELMAGADNHNAQHQTQRQAALQVCEEASVFHWPLAFPQVFAQGGFDCVLGNPPWERIKLQEEEFFATRSIDIATAKNKAERSKRIQWLSEGVLAKHLHPELEHGHSTHLAEQRLYQDFIRARRIAEATSAFVHVKREEGGRYPLTGVGDVNTYALFSETIYQIMAGRGFAGFIVPTGIATDSSTQNFFSTLIRHKSLVSLYDFDNSELVFPAVASLQRFCLITIGVAERQRFGFLLKSINDIQDCRRIFELEPSDFNLINPNTLTCPVLTSNKDALLIKKIYSGTPIFVNKTNAKKENEEWGVSFMRMFDMSTDSDLFKYKSDIEVESISFGTTSKNHKLPRFFPLYEAKMMTIYDHRFGSYPEGKTDNTRALPRLTIKQKNNPEFEVNSRFYVDKKEIIEKSNGYSTSWFLCFRSMSNHTNIRRFISGIVPYTALGNSLIACRFNKKIPVKLIVCLIANLSSLVLDVIARWKVSGTNLNLFLVEQFPIIPPHAYSDDEQEFIMSRVLELVYTTESLRGFAEDCGYYGSPFSFKPERRALLISELDALIAKKYGLAREDLCYILDPSEVMGDDYPSETFRVLKNSEIREFGEYRTQRLVLEAWDALEKQQPLESSITKPARRTAPLPYDENLIPSSAAEDWFAGLVCDVLLQAEPCDDTRLRLILGTPLPEGTLHAELLNEWLAPMHTERWTQISSWLRKLLGVPATAPLTISNPDALIEIIGDDRTESLASALIAARHQREAQLESLQVDPGLEALPESLKKQG